MSEASGHDTAHIWQSLAVNAVIAVIKIAAAVVTGSGAMLAEAIHSSADCSNQLLLLVGVKKAARSPDTTHPLGYGRDLYFWSFLVALLLFTAGGVFSIYEGIHKIAEPEPLEHIGIALGILLFSLCLEGNATRQNVVEMNKRRGKVSFWRYLRDTKDSDLVVIFGENAAASLGLIAASGSLLMAWQTGNPVWDGIGSLLVGIVLVLVAGFLAVEVKSLLIGERADPVLEQDIRDVAAEHREIEHIFNIITVQQGPGEVLAALKIKMLPTLATDDLCRAINRFEVAVRKRRPEIRWLFVEPDIED